MVGSGDQAARTREGRTSHKHELQRLGFGLGCANCCVGICVGPVLAY